MRDLLLAHRDPGTRWSSGVTCPDRANRFGVVRLADLDPVEVDMRCLLIVGSSQTQWYTAPSGDTVFTPRYYPSLSLRRAPQPFDGPHRPSSPSAPRAAAAGGRSSPPAHQIAGGGQLGLGEPSPLFW